VPWVSEPRAVNWYYANNGQQAGPVPEVELDALVQRGVVTPTTLVWRDGMADWQPYGAVRAPTRPVPAAPPVIGQTQCVECQSFFSKDDLLRYEDVFVCAACKPAFFQKLREGVAVGSAAGLWRDGKVLVMRHDAVLPDRCVKCNQPAHGYRLKRNLSWHTPWLYLLLLAAWLIYLIVALIVSKRARIQIGLCPRHRSIRKRDIMITLLLFVSSLGSFIIAGNMTPAWPYVLAGFAGLLASLIYGVVRVPMVQPKRIDNELVRLSGASKDFLAELPEFTGPR